MKINDNGIIRDMTPEEEAAYIKAMEKQEAMNPAVPTPEQRIADLEAELKATKILLGLEA